MLHKILFSLCVGCLLAAALPALADPPGRVGRVSFISGQVSFRADKDDEWSRAQLNYPVTGQNGFATSSHSRLEIRVGSAAIRVDEDSEISLPRLDDDLIRVNVKRGVANVIVRSRESRYPVEVLTPAGRLSLNSSGTYRIEAGRDHEQTIITAFQGSALLDSNDSQIAIREGRELVVHGIDPFDYSLRNARQGTFEDWVFARDARIDRSRSTRYVSPEIAGYEDLDEHGDWQETNEYGAVWVPRVAVAGWAPYRHGQWAWVNPWGWTWVDHAPWGFAPFHYGRWVYHHGYWGWAPGVIASRPVYAPALVGFVGRPGWSVSFSFGSAPAVGWVPLGYYDIYRPGYHCSPAYVRNINITNINVRHVNVSHVNWSNPPTPDYSLRRFPHAVTVVPQSTFASGKPVLNQIARLAAPVSEPVIGTAPRIAAPLRRVVVNEPGRAVTPQVTGPQTGRQPAATETPRRVWRGNDGRVVSDGNSVPMPPRFRTEGTGVPDAGSQIRRQPHRDMSAGPRIEPAPSHPQQRIERAESGGLAPPRPALDGSRKHPHFAAPPVGSETRREIRPEAPRATPNHPAPAMRTPPGGEGSGVGRRRVDL